MAKKEGGTAVGNALRFLAKQGKVIAPSILNIAGNITGISALEKLGDAISGDVSLSEEDKEILLAEIEKDKAIEVELTKRWVSDNQVQDWLPRNIRPLVVANFTLLIDVVIIASMWGKPLGEAYLPLLMTMGVTAIGGYFTLREYGKTQDKKK
jgi:hypothetical protein